MVERRTAYRASVFVQGGKRHAAFRLRDALVGRKQLRIVNECDHAIAFGLELVHLRQNLAALGAVFSDELFLFRAQRSLDGVDFALELLHLSELFFITGNFIDERVATLLVA